MDSENFTRPRRKSEPRHEFTLKYDGEYQLEIKITDRKQRNGKDNKGISLNSPNELLSRFNIWTRDYAGNLNIKNDNEAS